jgi:hypothetical protein
MVVDHETWPSEGRLGFCTSGEYAGCYALVTAEYEDRWIIYVSSMPDASGAVCRADDFSTIDELIESVISDMGIEWVPADIESKLEEEVFELRKHWRQLAKNSQRSWPGVKAFKRAVERLIRR